MEKCSLCGSNDLGDRVDHNVSLVKTKIICELCAYSIWFKVQDRIFMSVISVKNKLADRRTKRMAK